MAPMMAPAPGATPAPAPAPTKLPANPPPAKTTQIEVPTQAPVAYYPTEGTVVNYGYSYVTTAQPVYYVNYRR
jgi:hypothetical protein